MRVLHVLCDLSPGGAERIVLELCRRGAGEREVATVQGLGPLEEAFAGIRVTEGGRRCRRPGVGALARLVAAARRADLVHTHLFAGDLWGGLAARIAGRPWLSTAHNVDRDETWQRHARRLPRPPLVVAVSEAVARHVDWSRDVRVIDNGVDLARFSAPHRGGAGVLAVGRRVPQKGFDVLLDALPDGLPLRVAGDGPFHRDHPAVTWLGLRDDVPALLADADMLAVPSRWEGFGLAAVEGMAAGVPVVASAVDGLADVVGDAGLLVPPEDPPALRAALVRLRDDADLRAELGRRGRARARHFAIERMVDAYEALYRELTAA